MKLLPLKHGSCDDLQVTPAEFTGHKEIVRVDHHRSAAGDTEISFEFRKQRYCFSPERNSFDRLQFPDRVISQL